MPALLLPPLVARTATRLTMLLLLLQLLLLLLPGTPTAVAAATATASAAGAAAITSPPLTGRSLCHGYRHTCAILSPPPPSLPPTATALASPTGAPRRLLCWGEGFYGALGRGGGNDANLGDDEFPSAAAYVDLGRGVLPLAVACSGRTTCVLVAPANKVLCFGRVNWRPVSDQFVADAIGVASAPSASAVHLPTATEAANATAPAAVAVSVGETFACVLSASMALSCVGPDGPSSGYYRPNATAAVTAAQLPAFGPVRLGAPATDVGCGGWIHTCAVTTALRLRCFGYGGRGALGYGNTNHIGDDEYPSAAGSVAVGAPVLSLALSATYHSCVLTTGLRPRCFGKGWEGQLGLGHGGEDVGDNEHPSVFPGVEVGAPVVAMATGAQHTCCVTTGLKLRCWGNAAGGRLGYGRGYGYIGRDSPASERGRVQLGADGSSPRLQLPGTGVGRKAVAVVSYWESACVATTKAEVLCWGGSEVTYLGYPGLDVARANATPADYGGVVLGAPVAADPSLLQLRWCDSHFGNGSMLRSTPRQQQSIPVCALGFPFTLGLAGAPPTHHSGAVLHSNVGGVADARCHMGAPAAAAQGQAVAAREVVGVTCSSGGSVTHSLAGNHSLSLPHPAFARLPPTTAAAAAVSYVVKPAAPPPVTTSLQGTPLFPLPSSSSAAHFTTSHHRLQFRFGSSRPFRASFVVALDGATVAVTNRTQLSLSVASEGPHNLTVYTVDAGGVAEPSPQSLHWLTDFTPPSTQLISGPPQPATSSASAQFTFGCDDPSANATGSGSGGSQCSYRVTLQRAGALVTSAQSLAAAGIGGSSSGRGALLSLSPVTALAGGTASASRALAFRVWGAAVGTRPMYRVVAEAGAAAAALTAWSTLPSIPADSAAPLTLGPLSDGVYTLQLASGDGQLVSSLPFTVDTVAPITRVHAVTRQLVAFASASASSATPASAPTSAQWNITASSWSGDAPPAALWWRSDSSGGGQWTEARWPLSEAPVVATTAANATVLQVKAVDAAGNADAFPRSISWDSALQIVSAPDAPSAESTASFVLRGRGAASPALLRWRVDGGHWHTHAVSAGATTAAATAHTTTVVVSGVSTGPHVFEAQPLAADGSPDAVQPQPLFRTWRVLPSAVMQGNGIAFAALSDGPHLLTVRAVDAAGNVDRGNATYRWTVDTQPPQCAATLLRPAPAAWSGALPLFPCSSNRTVAVVGSEPLSQAHFRLDNQTAWWPLMKNSSGGSSAVVAAAATAAAARLEGTVHAAAGDDGQHTLWLKATDAVGNAAPAACASLVWAVDTTPPSAVQLTAPTATGWRTAARRWNGTIVAWDGTAGVAAAYYSVRSSAPRPAATVGVAAGAWALSLPSSSAAAAATVSFRSHVAVAAAADGQFSLWLKAVDAVGNVAVFPRAFNWTVDTEAPGVWFRSPLPPTLTARRNLSLCFAVSESETALWWRVRALQPPPLSATEDPPSPWILSTAANSCAVASVPGDGSYALAVKAQDRAGNTAVNESLHTWSVDTVAPTACTVSTPSLLVNSSAITVTFGPLGGPQGVVRHLYAVSPAAAASSAAPPLPQQQWVDTGGARTLHVSSSGNAAAAGGQFVLRVRAVDGAGNVGLQPCASLVWTLDVAPPTSIVVVPASNGALVNGAVLQVTLSHSEAVRSVAFHVPGMAARVMTVSVAPPSNVSHLTLPSSDGGAIRDGPRSAWFRAVDVAGNTAVERLWLHWVADTTPPHAALLHSPPLPRLMSSRTLVSRVRVSDGTAVAASSGSLWFATATLLSPRAPPIQWVASPLEQASGPQPRSLEGEIRLTVPSDGWFALALKAVDAAGNEYINTSAHTWGVDTTPPTSVIAAAPLNSTLTGGSGPIARFALRCTSTALACTHSFAATAAAASRCAPQSDCTSFQYRVVAQARGSSTGDPTSSSSSCGDLVIVPWTDSAAAEVQLSSDQLTAGALQFEARAVDAVGQVQLTPSAHRWLVSISEDVVVVIAAQPPPLTAWHTASFSFRSTLAGRTAYTGQRFQVRLDRATGPWQYLSRCSTSQSLCNHTLRGLSRGPHVLQVRAVDASSGAPSDTVSAAWTVGVCNATAYAVVSSSNGGALHCVQCPVGADCTREGTTLQSMGAQPGWWAPAATEGIRSSSDIEFHRCPLPDSCTGGGNASQAATCAGTFNSSSVLCGSCAPSHVRQGEACTRCPAAGLGVALMLLCTLLLVAFICFSASPSATALSTQQEARREEVAVLNRIIISFLVTLTTIGDFRARGPKLVREFIGLASTVSGGLSVRFAPIRCTLGLGFFAELLATLAMPWLLLTLCAVYVGVRVRLKPRFPVRQALVGCAVFTVFLVYPTVTRATLQVFRCSDVEVQGQRYLLHDLAVPCFRGQHAAAVAISAICTAIVGLGVPALVISRVARSHHSADSSAALKQEYRFLFDGYNADRLLWWEALVLLRKFGLQCVEVFVADPTIQAALASWLIVGALALHLWWQPYNTALLNRLDALSLTVSYVTQALSSMYSVLLRSTVPHHTAAVEVAVTALLLLLNIGTLLLVAGLAALRQTQQLRAQRRAAATTVPQQRQQQQQQVVSSCQSGSSSARRLSAAAPVASTQVMPAHPAAAAALRPSSSAHGSSGGGGGGGGGGVGVGGGGGGGGGVLATARRTLAGVLPTATQQPPRLRSSNSSSSGGRKRRRGQHRQQSSSLSFSQQQRRQRSRKRRQQHRSNSSSGASNNSRRRAAR